jgi:hypothetical protein
MTPKLPDRKGANRMPVSSIRQPQHRSHYSTRNGQALIEVCTILVVIIPLLLTILDCLFVCIGASLNESICRDAARAAAAGPPALIDKIATPKDRALTVIKHVYYSGLPMKVRDTIVVKENVRILPPASQGGYVDGEITVGTTIDIYPPFVLNSVGSGQVVLKSQHTVPITYAMPPS